MIKYSNKYQFYISTIERKFSMKYVKDIIFVKHFLNINLIDKQNLINDKDLICLEKMFNKLETFDIVCLKLEKFKFNCYFLELKKKIIDYFNLYFLKNNLLDLEYEFKYMIVDNKKI
jgi:hypothetical protein